MPYQQFVAELQIQPASEQATDFSLMESSPQLLELAKIDQKTEINGSCNGNGSCR